MKKPLFLAVFVALLAAPLLNASVLERVNYIPGIHLAESGALAAGNGANSAANGLKLGKQLASEKQVGELLAGQGKPLAGAGTDKALRAADGLAETYGGEASDWAKVGSSNYKAADGTSFETHAYQNLFEKLLVEIKTKFQ